jgi:hypothetical protein
VAAILDIARAMQLLLIDLLQFPPRHTTRTHINHRTQWSARLLPP